MDTIIKKIRRDLKAAGDEAVRKSGMNFFKEKVKLYGVKSAAVRKTGKVYFRLVSDRTKKEIFGLCEMLWQSGYLEESVIACDWSYCLRRDYEEADFKVFEKWVNSYVANWAACDTLCNHTVGAFVEMYPGYIQELKKWASSGNRWVRRASAVSLIIPAKQGNFLNDILEIADILLTDEDDMVQKGYGWMLKVAGNPHRDVIFNYVMARKKTMPRTALRYAIEKMPAELRKKAMEK